MPYTFAHPGFSIWLKNRHLKRLSLNGLIFGCMTPDLDILLKFTDSRFHTLSYSIPEILLILLPAAILLSFIFHQGVKIFLVSAMPASIRSKSIDLLSFDYKKFLFKHPINEIVSILIGIVFHLFLDYISHWNAYSFMVACHLYIYPSRALGDFYYYFGWYFPQVTLTGLGFYFIYKYYLKNINLKVVLEELLETKPFFQLFWIVYCLIIVIFAIAKLRFFGFEGDFGWHYLIIHLTAGVFFSTIFTPLLFKLFLSPQKTDSDQ